MVVLHLWSASPHTRTFPPPPRLLTTNCKKSARGTGSIGGGGPKMMEERRITCLEGHRAYGGEGEQDGVAS